MAADLLLLPGNQNQYLSIAVGLPVQSGVCIYPHHLPEEEKSSPFGKEADRTSVGLRLVWTHK